MFSFTDKSIKMTKIGVFAAIFDFEKRILCVRHAYGDKRWTTPGGQIESNESLITALEREVHEETGYKVNPTKLIGAYYAAYKDDLVLSIEAEIYSKDEWNPNDEISEIGFYGKEELPKPMHRGSIIRIQDAFGHNYGVIRIFNKKDDVVDS
jgi:8-oxo-dGTP pyrophosphatase MutT (NUDIX family)